MTALGDETPDPLIDIVRDAIHNAIHDRCGEAWVETEIVVAAVRAALAASPTTEPGDGLNVEHLAAALRIVVPDIGTFARGIAANVAAEYAALAEHRPAGGETIDD